MNDDMFCGICGTKTECRAGCSAHPINWYCPKCEKEEMKKKVHSPEQFTLAAELITQIVANTKIYFLPKEDGKNPTFTINSNITMYDVLDLMDKYKELKDE